MTVGGLTMISRVLGFIRDISIAAVLGTGVVADAFFVAFRFPNLFRRLFGEGAFNAAFVPLFSKELEANGKTAARQFAEEALSGLLFVLLVLTAIAEISMPWLMYAIAPGFADTPDKYDLAVLLTRIAFPYLLCMSLVALLSGMLNALDKFAAAAAAPIVLNIILISAIGLAAYLDQGNTSGAGVILAWGVAIAGVVQLILLAMSAARSGMRLKLKRPRMTPGVKKLVTLGIPGVIAGGITQINIMIGTIIASLQDSAVSYLYYADRIYQLPLGVVGIAIGVVLLPDISKKLRAGNMAAVHKSQNRSLEFALMLTLPASIALFLIPTPIIQVLFERGAFDLNDTSATALALSAFAWGLPAFVLIKVFSPAFFAREDTKTPMRFAGVSMVVNVVLSLALFYALKLNGIMPHLGIAIATTVAGWVNALLLWRALAKNGQFEFDAQLKRNLPLIILASLLMGACVWWGARWAMPYLSSDNGLWVQIGALGLLIITGVAVFAAAIQIFRVAHLPSLLRGRS